MMHRILLINEDFQFQNVIKTLLRNEAYSVLSFLGGKKGMEAVKSIHTNLIISDLMLSYKSSLEWIAYIKEQPVSRNTPLIILSPISNIEMISDCMEIGVTEYIKLPFDPQDLIRKVEEVLLINYKLELEKVEL